MNAQTKIEAENVHKKLNRARRMFHATKLRKTGKNAFAGYNYFELGDFLVPALNIFDEVGLAAVVSFTATEAVMVIYNCDDPIDTVTITSPMGSAALKGCHEVQNIGAVETYQRRYLWVTALEIVEHDALDATQGRDAGANQGRSLESAVSPDGPALIDDVQWSQLAQLMKASGADAKKFLAHYAITDLRDLPATSFSKARDQLNTKLAKKVKEETNKQGFGEVLADEIPY